MHRRDFLLALPAVAAAGFGARGAMAQAPQSGGNIGAANAPMDAGAYRPLALPPKPGAEASMTKRELDALEHEIRCQCGCTLDVFTCRTTDFSCQVSPAMHRDLQQLVAGGYTADEIIAAMEKAYGERVLMAPKKEGFNWVGYIAPFAAIGTGAVALTVLLRSWRDRSHAVAAAGVPAPAVRVDATDEELARLERAVRGEDR